MEVDIDERQPLSKKRLTTSVTSVPRVVVDDHALVEVPVHLCKADMGKKIRRYKSKTSTLYGNAKIVMSLGYSDLGLSQKLGSVIEQIQIDSISNAVKINAIRSRRSS